MTCDPITERLFRASSPRTKYFESLFYRSTNYFNNLILKLLQNLNPLNLTFEASRRRRRDVEEEDLEVVGAGPAGIKTAGN